MFKVKKMTIILYFRFENPGLKLQVSEFRFIISAFGIQNSGFRFQISDFVGELWWARWGNPGEGCGGTLEGCHSYGVFKRPSKNPLGKPS